jgi:hypothetical protein
MIVQGVSIQEVGTKTNGQVAREREREREMVVGGCGQRVSGKGQDIRNIPVPSSWHRSILQSKGRCNRNHRHSNQCNLCHLDLHQGDGES